MTTAAALLALTGVGLAVAALARRWHLSAPLLLTLTGVAASFLPVVPSWHVDPEVILLGLLPPLLYGAAIRTSLLDLGSNRRNIALLSVVLVIVTAVAVGLVAWQLLGIPLALAIALGGVVAPPDAVAATAIARRIGLPRRIVTILEGESLFNDATALVILRMGLVATGAAVTLGEVTLQFVWAAGGGVAVGIVVAKVVNVVRRRVTEPTLDTALSLMVPWLAYLPAEAVHCSGVLAVVVAGVLLGHTAPVAQTAVSRMSERINWNTVEFLLENAVFLVIGLQAKGIVEDVSANAGWAHVYVVALAVLLAVILVRPLVVVPLKVFDRRAGGGVRDRMKGAVVVSWAGMRGVVTLAAAFTIPEGAPQRNALVLIALVVTIGTLVLQGFTLPWVARRLDIHGPDPREDVLQTATVMQRAVDAGRDELDRVVTSADSPEIVDALRTQAQRRTDGVWERLGAERVDEPTPSETYRRLRQAMLTAERAEVLRLRDEKTVDHVVLSEVLATLDVEESVLATAGERQRVTQERIVTTPETVRGDCEDLQAAPTCLLPRTPDGCGQCLVEGSTWVHLRLCLTCGEVGCCDSSPQRHATAHNAVTGHPVIRSFEPGEAWRWCYPHQLLG
ncbi:MAG: Na+/H+ antiporter [Dermatophilaceae bacterium]